jgi:hypothetical protein
MDRAGQNETGKIMQQLGSNMQEVDSLNFFGIALQRQNIAQCKRKITVKKFRREGNLLSHAERAYTY